jgi:hypothetical protein
MRERAPALVPGSPRCRQIAPLARRAPVQRSVRVALAASADRSAAARAWPAGTTVDAPRLPRAIDRVVHEPARGLERSPKLAVGELAEPRPGRELRRPERLGHPHVADARDETLLEQRLAQRHVTSGAPKVRKHRVEVGRVSEDVGPEALDDVTAQLEHRSVPLHRLVLSATENEPGSPDQARPTPTHRPPSLHAQVAPQDDPALEAEQQVLADGLDTLEAATIQPLRDPLHGRPRVRTLDLDPLADENSQAPRYAVNRVALGHSKRIRG